MLAELLLFAGNLERADTILDAAARTDPSGTVIVAEFRQLLRAETARRQLTTEGRVPEFLGEPPAALRAALAAHVALRAGDAEEAARHAAEAEELRPRVAGILGAKDAQTSFDDLRDADDLCAGFFETLTTTGKYYWIPTERIASVELHPPRRPRDLAWRRATMSVIDGPDGEVYLPAMYEAATADVADELRLGRSTDWTSEDRPPVRGVGQRLFLIGEDAIGIMDIASLRFGT
jgi:type VI secretion system protein ImpE